ncbi:uncharacterized protein DSM5745_05720 [Aspergillus mulundensis]|uniref:DUF6594 domain-containing protein n=1 Tax=Aspergillus mulundensis TaxID=1810919 RepID=A0A3D8RXY1_9EURO|nr:hypothetical protein DSM5745_05720 [Aspergillus mulundensis]RDW78868.1 hypothetical protein DSM5745_05720 [Aspergillus mulundensis]
MSATTPESSTPQQQGEDQEAAHTFDYQQMRDDPGKYVGYRGYGYFVSSTDDFGQYRSFDALNATVMLRQQAEIAKIEQDLETRERQLRSPDRAVHNGTFLKNPDEERMRLLDEAQAKLEQYYRYTHSYVQFKQGTSTTERERDNLKRWHGCNKNAIDQDEKKYIHKEDLHRILPKAIDPVRDILLGWKYFRKLPFWKSPAKEELPYFADPDNETVASTEDELPIENQLPYYISPGRVTVAPTEKVDRMAKLVTATMGMVLILGPIWTLAYITELHFRLLVVSIAISAFAYFLAHLHPEPSYDVFPPTGGYAAVLMVYLSAT